MVTKGHERDVIVWDGWGWEAGKKAQTLVEVFKEKALQLSSHTDPNPSSPPVFPRCVSPGGALNLWSSFCEEHQSPLCLLPLYY